MNDYFKEDQLEVAREFGIDFSTTDDSYTLSSLMAIPALIMEVARLRSVLEKIADPRKRDHQEPDKYTELACVMHMANEALKGSSDE